MADLQLYAVSDDGILSFDLAGKASRASGIAQLVQEVTIELASDYNPLLNRGCNLGRNLANITSDDDGTALQVASEAIASAKSLIQVRQTSNPALLPEERLADLTVVSASSSVSGWVVGVELTPVVGPTIRFPVGSA